MVMEGTMSEPNRPAIGRAIVQMAIVVLIAPFIPMIISGDWGWWEAWALAATSILTFVISRAIVYRVHPDLIAERARAMEAKDTKPWDRVLAPLLLLGSMVILVVAGLDRHFGWSSRFSMSTKLIALTGIIFGYAFSSWALIENRFFSGTVRIQTERGHHVVTTGPYRLVRHPGYVGGLLGFLLIPVLLDSQWAFIPAILLALVMIARTALEDKTLQEELPGYQEFTQKTKYRLVPGIW
jgi:protein-S-isoprenylcysteine O-methyltransferase Ste14